MQCQNWSVTPWSMADNHELTKDAHLRFTTGISLLCGGCNYTYQRLMITIYTILHHLETSTYHHDWYSFASNLSSPKCVKPTMDTTVAQLDSPGLSPVHVPPLRKCFCHFGWGQCGTCECKPRTMMLDSSFLIDMSKNILENYDVFLRNHCEPVLTQLCYRTFSI